jgi:ATP-dependent DNA helicase RecQ
VLLYAPEDKGKMKKRIADNYPPKEFVEKVYHNASDFLCVGAGSGEGHTFSLHIDELCRVMRLPVLQTYSALHLLSQAGYIDFQEEQETQARVRLNASRQEMADYRLSAAQQELIQRIMRNYPGVFTDLQYVHEDINNEVHELLAGLAARHIITYIPRTRACAITYVQERQTEIRLSPETYEKRAESYTERLRAMSEYAGQSRFCRQQLLQHYFGEDDAEPCGTCDVCRAALKQKTDTGK